MTSPGAEVEVLGPTPAPRERDRAERLAAEVWAMAYVVAEIMNGADPTDVLNDLPSDVRRRVIAVRHQSSAMRVLPARDQYGPLPTPPARASVMRNRVRTIDGSDSLPDRLV